MKCFWRCGGRTLVEREQNTWVKPHREIFIKNFLSRGLLQSKHKWVLEPVSLQGAILFSVTFFLHHSTSEYQYFPKSCSSHLGAQVMYSSPRIIAISRQETTRGNMHSFPIFLRKSDSSAQNSVISSSYKKEAKLIQFRITFYSKSTPGKTKKHRSSVSGRHHLSFCETLRLLTMSQFQCESHYVQTSLHLPLLQITAPHSLYTGEKWGRALWEK